jgi:hypothetical protein
MSNDVRFCVSFQAVNNFMRYEYVLVLNWPLLKVIISNADVHLFIQFSVADGRKTTETRAKREQNNNVESRRAREQ